MESIIRNKFFLLFGIVFSISLFIYGQNINYTKLKPKQLLKLAEEAERIGDVYSAIEFYDIYLTKKPNDFAIQQLLADNYRKSRDYKKAADIYGQIIQHDDQADGLVYYYLADMQMYLGDYASAESNFNLARKKRISSDEKYFVKNKMEGCQMAMNPEFTNERIKIVHQDTSINKINSELSPVFLEKDKLLFASLRLNEINYYNTDETETNYNVSKIYKAGREKDTLWQFEGEWLLNNNDYFTGNLAFSPDYQKLYFTRCNQQWGNKINCTICKSEKTANGWSEPVKLNDKINLTGYTSTQVTVGRESKRNKEVIYFVSDRPGGRGGYDIWYTVYNHFTNEYSDPRNAGVRINSAGDELSPFVDIRSGTLYFSSDFHPGFGGLDVFFTKGEMRKWSKVKNHSSLINSSFDELYFTLNPFKRNEGFFVSNRPGSNTLLHETCCDDLYYYQMESVNKIYIKGQVFNDETSDSSAINFDQYSNLLGNKNKNVIIDSSMISLFRNQQMEKNKLPISKVAVSVFMFDEESNEDILIYTDSTDNKGYYFHELEPLNDYKIVFKKDEYFNKNMFVSTKKIGWQDTIQLSNISISKIPSDPIQFSVYYESNSDELMPASKLKIDTTLLAILEESPELIVEISSHTDSIGLEDYNMKLSQHRAQTVVDYLISNGIDKARLIAVGYGEAYPMAPNNTEEGRTLNRRTEFIVIGSIDEFSKLNVSEMKITKKNKNRDEIIKKLDPKDIE